MKIPYHTKFSNYAVKVDINLQFDPLPTPHLQPHQNYLKNNAQSVITKRSTKVDMDTSSYKDYLKISLNY